jgi:uncharacterized RDD family membrane protein YckC
MSDSEPSSNVILAKWTDRFLAWLIDFLIISSISTLVIFTIFGTVDYEFGDDEFWAESKQYFPTSILFFAYWTILEYKTGQTIGKKILNLKVVNINGKKPDLKGILISGFGKSFILPIDVVLGWCFTNEKRQRIFNKLGDTLIVKIKKPDDISDIKYTKD